MFARINWKSAVGEVALIIVGILVALAVDAWWDGRNDAATERAYLRQLLVDVEGNERAMGDLLSRHTTAMNDANRLAAAFDAKGPLPSCDTMAEQLLSTLSWQPLELRTGTYAALLATGEIRLIENDRLRAEVVRYAGIVDSVTRLLAQDEMNAWSAAQPFRRRVTFLWRLDLIDQPRKPSELPPWSGCNFEPFRQDPEIRDALMSTALLHSNRIEAVNDLRATNLELRAQVQTELGEDAGQ